MSRTPPYWIPEPYAPAQDGEAVERVTVETSAGRTITLSDPDGRVKSRIGPDMIHFDDVAIEEDDDGQ